MTTPAELALCLRDGGDVDELFPALDETLKPVMIRLARRFAPSLGLTVDDALQEARIAVREAFHDYDYTASKGGIRRFAAVVVKNAFLSLLYRATTRQRVPHTVYERDGETMVARHSVASLDALIEERAESQWEPAIQVDFEADLDAARMSEKVKVLATRLMRSLNERERAVYRCKVMPPDGYLVFLRNLGVAAGDAQNVHIARYLGINKNAVDWSLHKVKGAFVALAERPEFSVVIAGLVRGGRWPMIHHSTKADDAEYVRAIIQDRDLDPRPVAAREISVSNSKGRIIERYPWGAIVYLRRGDAAATLVVEGRFNVLTGEVISEFGNWKSIVEAVPWYKALARELKE